MLRHLTPLCVVLLWVSSLEAVPAAEPDRAASPEEGAPTAAETPRSSVSRTVLFPVLAAAPLFGASVTLPPIQGPGGGIEIPSGTTDSSFNGAALAGFRIDRDRWLLEVDGLWAGLSSERTLPRVRVSSDVVYGIGMFGWRAYRDLLVVAGVRRLAVKIGAEVSDFPKVERKPGVWDPLVGVGWRKAAGRSWLLEASFTGGGFGAGADVDLGGHVSADWRFSNRLGLRLGYSMLHFKITDTRLGKTLESSQTLHGPILGVGIYFGKR